MDLAYCLSAVLSNPKLHQEEEEENKDAIS